MQGNSSGGALVAAALILGASIVGGAYLLTMSIDRGSAQLVSLNESLKAAAAAPAAAPKPSAPSAPGRPDPQKVYDIKVGNSPVRGGKDAKI
ncbi:MAG: hypothetical protein ACC649_05775, partial [Myxococcota bacterium]